MICDCWINTRRDEKEERVIINLDYHANGKCQKYQIKRIRTNAYEGTGK